MQEKILKQTWIGFHKWIKPVKAKIRDSVALKYHILHGEDTRATERQGDIRDRERSFYMGNKIFKYLNSVLIFKSMYFSLKHTKYATIIAQR